MADFTQSFLQLSGGRELLSVVKIEQLLAEWTNLDPVGIRLSNKSFDQESATKVSEYLEKVNSTLQIADISDVIAGRPEEEALKAIKVLATGLKRFELVEINVSDNAFGAKGIEVCREILTGKRMEKLYVCNNGLSAEACQLLSEILLDGACPPLKVFHFYNNMSGDGGGKALSTLIKACTDLEDLRFSATRCGNAGCMEIAKAIGVLNKLKKIDLSDNTFGLQAAKVLAESLKAHANTLETLNLRDDGFTADGVEAMFGILESTTFPHLTTLDLSGNEIAEDTMDVLADWLATAVPNLTHLYLDDNEIGSDGILLLSRVIAKLTNLTVLSLNTCELTAKGAFSIVKAVSKLPKFHKLDINGNMIAANGVEEIQGIMVRANKLLGDLDDNDEDGEDDLGDLSDSGEEDGQEDEEDKAEEEELVNALKSATI